MICAINNDYSERVYSDCFARLSREDFFASNRLGYTHLTQLVVVELPPPPPPSNKLTQL